MVIGGKTREEERLLACHRGWGRLWRPCMLAQRLRLQCSGDRSRVSSTSSESLSDGQMTCGGCCFDCQGKPSQEEENQEPFQPTMEHRERHSSFLFYAMPSKQPSTLYYYYIYTEACASVELHYAMQYGYAMLYTIACKAVRATVVLLDRASCCCCFPSDQKGTRKGRRRCFRPINLLGRTSNFQTFKSFLMSRRSSSIIAIRCTLGMPPPQRAFSSPPPPFLGDAAPATSLSLFFGAIISPGLSCHLG